jgi:putative tryptophan/tyrosine transport system substrate-binding protein
MRRRKFLALVGGTAVWPLAAQAQEPGRVYRLGSLHQSPHDAPHHVALLAELRKSGFTEGVNLIVDMRGYGAHPDQFPELARSQVGAKVDAILCGGEAAGRVAQQVTTTIPLIVVADDMVRAGLATSLAKSGRNTTGISILGTELDGKRQEILFEAVPGISHMAALSDPSSSTVSRLRALEEGARARGIKLSIQQVTRPEEIADAVATAKAIGAEALNVLASALLFNNSQIIMERTVALGLPAIYQWPETAEAHGFLGYGPRILHIYRDLISGQLIKVLRGAWAGEIPIEQPTRFELVINLKVAKTMGITVPATLLAQADEVIE